MNGLQEYYEGTKYEPIYETIYKALYHKNKFRLRDIAITLHDKVVVDELHDKDNTLNSFYNTLLHEELGDYEVQARILAHFISFYVEDPYIERLHQFLMWHHWNEVTDIPDMNDFFSRGQVNSKLWLINELKRIITNNEIGTVALYGGWYSFLSHMLDNEFKVDTIYSMDLDPKVIKPASYMYKDILNYRFRPLQCNVNDNKWDEEENLWYVDEEKRDKDYKAHYTEKIIEIQQGYYDPKKSGIWHTLGWKKIGAVDIVINTSCEHMDNRWFYKLPAGTLVALQTNNYFENPQHSNCAESLDAVRHRYPMEKVFYEGALPTALYDRFMLIGLKKGDPIES